MTGSRVKAVGAGAPLPSERGHVSTRRFRQASGGVAVGKRALLPVEPGGVSNNVRDTQKWRGGFGLSSPVG